MEHYRQWKDSTSWGDFGYSVSRRIPSYRYEWRTFARVASSCIRRSTRYIFFTLTQSVLSRWPFSFSQTRRSLWSTALSMISPNTSRISATGYFSLTYRSSRSTTWPLSASMSNEIKTSPPASRGYFDSTVVKWILFAMCSANTFLRPSRRTPSSFRAFGPSAAVLGKGSIG